MIKKYKDLYDNPNDIRMLNQTIFSLLEYGKGLILDEIGDEMLDTTEFEWPPLSIKKYHNLLNIYFGVT